MGSKKIKSADAPNSALPADDAENGVASALPKPNMKFCGRNIYDRQKRKIIRVNAPIESFLVDGQSIQLPSADFQIRRRLFYHESAALITTLFPHLYKKLKDRG